MKQYLFILLLLVLPMCSWAVSDYAWQTPSYKSTEAMPVGGGDIGLNVWMDSLTDEVLCYVAQSGWFDENNTLLKAGLLRIQVGNKCGAFVEQRLCLEDGYQQIRWKHATLTIWVDVWKPVVHIEADKPIRVAYECWRTEVSPVNKAIGQQSSWKWIVPKGTVTRADQRVDEADGGVLFWHQNLDSTVWDYTVRQQQLEAYASQLYNPLKGRIMGGHLKRQSQKHYTLTLCNLLCKAPTAPERLGEWKRQLTQTETGISTGQDRKLSRQWWNGFWQRSYIEADASCSDTVKTMIRNYNLFRYLLGCNAHPSEQGERWPTKFNGGLFTFNPLDADTTLLKAERETPGLVTPDYRKWGGGTHTAQNQRLVYWPMLRTGDWDALQGQLDFYLRLLPTAELRSRHYWNLKGACFTEQLENFGLPNPAEYGKHKNGGDPGIEDNRWLEYEWDTALEFAQMMLLSRHPRAVEFALACLRFFDHYYTRPGEPFCIYPGSGCETYKIARNPASTLAALQRVSATLAEMESLSNEDRIYVVSFGQRLPDLPLYKQLNPETGDSVTCYAPAEAWERIQNVETPQLYPVWPWRMADRETGRNTYLCDSVAIRNRSHIGWKQDNIWAAELGLTDEAFRLTAEKLLAHPYRFPAFWGPGFDWMPDLNWGGSAMIGLQEMLLQEAPDGSHILLPAWPKDQRVRFRLYDSKMRPVEYKTVKILKSVTLTVTKTEP
jgi:hypothetical protein